MGQAGVVAAPCEGQHIGQIGLGLGAIGSFLLGQALRQGLGPLIAQNYLILAGTSAVIFAVSLLATWYSARRATKADPIEALRAE